MCSISRPYHTFKACVFNQTLGNLEHESKNHSLSDHLLITAVGVFFPVFFLAVYCDCVNTRNSVRILGEWIVYQMPTQGKIKGMVFSYLWLKDLHYKGESRKELTEPCCPTWNSMKPNPLVKSTHNHFPMRILGF